MDAALPESRPNKRKLRDAIQSLDDAVVPLVDRPSPPKRQNTLTSIYTTLSKYGIKTKGGGEATESSSFRSVDPNKTPRLAAILARTGTKTRKVLPFTRRSTGTSTSEYRPSSTASFLARLETYKLNTYSNKPPEIDAVAASKAGWVNEGKDRLHCGVCGISWVVVGREKMSRDAANVLVKKQQAQLVDNHKDGCPWKIRQCDADVYRIQLSSPSAMAKDIKSRALLLEPLLENIEVKHPLSSAQVQSLVKTISSVNLDDLIFSLDRESSGPSSQPNGETQKGSAEPSASAILSALFGWSIAPPMPPPTLAKTPSHSGTPALSRASSVAPSAPATPRKSTAAAHGHLQETPLPARGSTPSLSRVNSRLLSTPRANPMLEQQPTMLHCSLCLRKLGLWAFGSSSMSPAALPKFRQIDVLKEHRPYCPYVTRSATVPALPVPQNQPLASASTATLASLASAQTIPANGVVEGWRAVLLVVLRHRMGQRQWENLLNGATRRIEGQQEHDGHGPEDVSMDPVGAMVADVKKKGGRELLNYVRGLLG